MSYSCEPITTYILHNQTIYIGEQNISCISSADICTDRHALMANSLAGLMAYLLAVEELFGEYSDCTPMILDDLKMRPRLLVTFYSVIISDELDSPLTSVIYRLQSFDKIPWPYKPRCSPTCWDPD